MKSFALIAAVLAVTAGSLASAQAMPAVGSAPAVEKSGVVQQATFFRWRGDDWRWRRWHHRRWDRRGY